MQRSDLMIDMPQILSILNAIAGQLDFRSVIRAVSNEIKALLPHDHLDVALVSVDGVMVTAYETGLHTEWDAATTAKTPVAISPIRELLTGKVDHIITPDAQNDPRFHFEGAFSHAIFAAGLRSRLHAPLKVEGRVIGGLSFSTQEIGTYRPTDVRQARIVADILAPYFFALRQSELVRERELLQVETEARAEGLRTGALHLTEELENARQALGMDLHDQTLADLSRIARALRRLVVQQNLHGDHLEPLLEDIEHCIRELRVIIDNAKPSVLQFFGFGQAVEALLERSVGAAPAPLSYDLDEADAAAFDKLPPNTVVALYRIVQEAINNVVRHAQARHITVRLGYGEGRARLVIEDDGLGLADSPGRRTGGLSNMFTRASLIGAELKATAGEAGKGTRLELRLPLAAVERETVHTEAAQ
jgi:signal transduction histidine kinase